MFNVIAEKDLMVTEYPTTEYRNNGEGEVSLTRQTVICEEDQSSSYFYNLSMERFARDKISKEQAAQNGAYHGCGHGFVVIDKESDTVIKMSYSTDGKTITTGFQNVDCLDGIENVVLWENDQSICFLANFSCWQACLF